MSIEALSGDENDIHVRLAETEDEVIAAQRLRYKVFYEEHQAKPSTDVATQKRDFDKYDAAAKHLIVVDPNRGKTAETQIVGTYRMINQEAADQVGQFYSSDEYDISLLKGKSVSMLELGRSCVLEEYRTRAVLQLLWKGIAYYVFDNEIGLTFGCASLHGTDPNKLKEELSYLHHFHKAPPDLCVKALPERYTDMNLMPKDQINEAEVFQKLPPLIKGYLRIGAKIGDGAVIDYDFNTVDVFITLPTSYVRDKYLKHYERTTQKTVAEHIFTSIPPLEKLSAQA